MNPLADELTTLWGQITAATHRFLELLAEFDEQEVLVGCCSGILSCAHWLNVYCGIGVGAAREKVRVARALQRLPEINAAFGRAEVSYSKVRAMTRVATPENETILLNIARHGTAAHVERAVSSYRRVERIEAAQAADEIYRHRYLDLLRDDDDSVVIRGRLPAEVGELDRQALERADALADSSSQAPLPEDDRPVAARRADALKIVVEQFLSTAASEMGSVSDRYQVVVHIDGASLSELENGTAMAAATIRRLACDSVLVGMVDDAEGNPLSVGRKTRAIPSAIRRALRARDRGCRFPGCTHTRFTEAHHVKHWADGGETRISNLVTLCNAHHHLLHEGDFQVQRADDGGFRFLQPNGLPVLSIENTGQRPPDEDGRFRGNAMKAISHACRDRGLSIGPHSIRTRWQGETMDITLLLDAMLAAREREEKKAMAPTPMPASSQAPAHPDAR